MRCCRGLLIGAVALLLLVVVTIPIGCSADPPPTRWQEVASGSFTGAETERIDLGTLYLTRGVRLAWVLSGQSDARAEFRLEASRSPDALTSQTQATSVRSWKENFASHSDEALMLMVQPDYYQVMVVQRVGSEAGVGYAGTFTLYTQDLD